MKYWIGLACAIVLLASCTSFPNPSADQNCLIVGNMILDFPDGFFSNSPRRIAHGIQMNIKDLDENKPLRATTSLGGYFYFMGKSSHKYSIETWEARIDESSTIYNFGPYKFGFTLVAAPGKVMYLQNILFTYRRPKMGDEQGHIISWKFDISVSTEWNPDGVREFIETKQKGSGWLDCEFVQAETQRSEGN